MKLFHARVVAICGVLLFWVSFGVYAGLFPNTDCQDPITGGAFETCDPAKMTPCQAVINTAPCNYVSPVGEADYCVCADSDRGGCTGMQGRNRPECVFSCRPWRSCDNIAACGGNEQPIACDPIPGKKCGKCYTKANPFACKADCS
jgi:hypothetical protein